MLPWYLAGSLEPEEQQEVVAWLKQSAEGREKLESLRQNEFSIPLVTRGPYPSRLMGLNVELEFDPAIIALTGVDVAQGMRVFESTAYLTLSSATELVGQGVAGDAGRIRFAIRSFVSRDYVYANGLTGSGTTEIPVARLRFRAVGAGTTAIRFVANSFHPGERLFNLGILTDQPATVFQPANGYGPGVVVTVDGS